MHLGAVLYNSVALVSLFLVYIAMKTKGMIAKSRNEKQVSFVRLYGVNLKGTSAL